ncbi:hydrolase, partial [Streptomyces sp. SID2119]|nr:hydrolase [Streptomyces sp. SID2119]
DPADLARNPADCAYAVEQLLDAVERLTRAAGSAALSDGSPLERIWRDLHSLSSHVALRFDPAAVAYGARLLELSGGPDSR